MKIATTCCLGLLLIIGSTVSAQRKVIRPPSPSCDGYSDLVEWGSQFRFNPCRTGYNPYEVILSPATIGNLVLDWSREAGSYPDTSPAVANGVVYIGSRPYNQYAPAGLYAFDAVTGALLWKYLDAGAVTSSPAVANGVVYFAAADDNLYALNATTGAPLWNHSIGYFYFTSPTVANGVVYMGAYWATYAFNAATGAPLWTDSNPSGGLAVANGVVYVGGGDGIVRALDASTGAPLWQGQPTGYAFGSPAVANGVVYVANGLGLCALNASTGAPLWNVPEGGVVAVANGVVYFGYSVGNYPYTGTLYALNADTGAPLWTYATDYQQTGWPTVANGVVYFGASFNSNGYAGALYALNASTGALLWEYTTGWNSSSPAVADGMVYLDAGGNLYAFHLPNSLK